MLEVILEAKKALWTPDGNDEGEYVLFINNLETMSFLEMGAIVEDVLRQFEKKSIRPTRIYAPSYITSLNAPRFSISLLNLSSTVSNLSTKGLRVEDLKTYLDDPTAATACVGVKFWPSRARLYSQQHLQEPAASSAESSAEPAKKSQLSKETWDRYTKATAAACHLKLEPDLTKWDPETGDGDCGETYVNRAKVVLKFIDGLGADVGNAVELVDRVGGVLEDSMGGTIGALFALFFTTLSTFISSLDKGEPTRNDWARAVQSALAAQNRHTFTQSGNRTLIDSFQPFSALLSNRNVFAEVVKKVKEGGESARKLRSVLGRAA